MLVVVLENPDRLVIKLSEQICSVSLMANFPGIYPYMVYVSWMQDQVRQKVIGRVKRIAGQITGVQRMIEEERYCVDVLNQISAVRSALDALGVELLTNHLKTCVLGRDKSRAHPTAKPMKPEDLVAEVHSLLSRFLR